MLNALNESQTPMRDPQEGPLRLQKHYQGAVGSKASGGIHAAQQQELHVLTLVQQIESARTEVDKLRLLFRMLGFEGL